MKLQEKTLKISNAAYTKLANVSQKNKRRRQKKNQCQPTLIECGKCCSKTSTIDSSSLSATSRKFLPSLRTSIERAGCGFLSFSLLILFSFVTSVFYFAAFLCVLNLYTPKAILRGAAREFFSWRDYYDTQRSVLLRLW